MARLLAFTGGLDSTWILQKMLNQPSHNGGEHVYPVYMDFFQGSKAAFLEYLLSSEIGLRLLNHTSEYNEPLNWLQPPESIMSGAFINHNPAAPRLIQQGNAVLGLAWLMNRQLANAPGSTATVGWNKADFIENSMLQCEWSEQDYIRLKNMYSDIMYFQDHHYRTTPLLTPAWDKEKIDMWNDLPANVRELITVVPYYAIRYHHLKDENAFYIVAKLNAHGKAVRYQARGIELSAAWRIEMDSAYYSRISKSNCPKNGFGGEIPEGVLTIPETEVHLKDNLSLKKSDETLLIKAYSVAEWETEWLSVEIKLRQQNERDSEARRIASEKAQRDKQSASDAKTVDSPAGEVATGTTAENTAG